MSRRPSAAMVEAMKLVLAGVTPYMAAKRVQISLSTMYRNQMYKNWRDGQDIRGDLDQTKPKSRTRKKPLVFAK